MKWFRKLLEVGSNPSNITGFADEALRDQASKALPEFARDNNVFVFSPTKNVEEKHIDKIFSEDIEKIDAPFNVFSIELSENTPITSSEGSHMVETGYNILIWCILVVEVQPKEYILFELIEMKELFGVGKSSFHVFQQYLNANEGWEKYNEQETVKDNLLPLIKVYLDRIATEKSGLQSVREKFKVGIGKHKSYHTVKKVIHITPEKYITAYTESIKKEINWSHRWSVRGHWRTCKGIGKDREGNYCVENFTWVKSHTKGPEDLPVIKKQRVVT